MVSGIDDGWCSTPSGLPCHEGRRPQGARDEQEAAHWVRGMFGRVAHRYDLANHLLSFNIDRFWRAHTVRRVRPILERPGARVLDICCGTGDLMLALERAAGDKPRARWFSGPISATPCWPSRTPRSRRRRAARAVRSRRLAPAVARRLARPGHGGFRFSQPGRITRPAWPRCAACCGPAAWPPSWNSRSRRTGSFGPLYNFYSRRMLPLVGGALSGSRDAYSYLPESVRRFPSAAELAARMRRAGFEDVRYRIPHRRDRGAASGARLGLWAFRRSCQRVRVVCRSVVFQPLTVLIPSRSADSIGRSPIFCPLGIDWIPMRSNAQRGFLSALLVLAAFGTANAQVRPAEAPEMPPDKFITVNGVRLQYLDWGGTGEALLFLTSLGGTAGDFQPLATQFTDSFHVFGLTRRGQGKSEKPETGYDTATLTQDIVAFLDTMNIRPSYLWSATHWLETN